MLGGDGWAQGLRHQQFAAVRLRRYKLPHSVAPDCERIEQSMHGELGVAGGGRAVVRFVVVVAGDQRPGGIIEIHVEPGQHQRAVRQPRDGFEQLGGRRHRAGGAGGDHRRVAADKPLGFGLDQFVAALGLLDGVLLGQDRAPARVHEFEEVERLLPIFVEVFRHQFVEIVPRHLARDHVVHQPRQRIGQRHRGLRRVGDQRRALLRRDGRRPFRDEFREREPSL